MKIFLLSLKMLQSVSFNACRGFGSLMGMNMKFLLINFAALKMKKKPFNQEYWEWKRASVCVKNNIFKWIK